MIFNYKRDHYNLQKTTLHGTEQPTYALDRRPGNLSEKNIVQGVPSEVLKQARDLQLSRVRRRYLPSSIRQRNHLLPQGAYDGQEEDAANNHDPHHSHTPVSFSF